MMCPYLQKSVCINVNIGNSGMSLFLKVFLPFGPISWVSELAGMHFITDLQFYFVILYHRVRIERVQRASAQFENLNGHLGLPWTPSHVHLPVEPTQFTFSTWKWNWGVIIEMLVSMPETR